MTTEWLIVVVVGVVSWVCGAHIARKGGFNDGYAQGHTRGVLDATPWDCGCGCRNPPNTMMCAFCGADREFPTAGES